MNRKKICLIGAFWFSLLLVGCSKTINDNYITTINNNTTSNNANGTAYNIISKIVSGEQKFVDAHSNKKVCLKDYTSTNYLCLNNHYYYQYSSDKSEEKKGRTIKRWTEIDMNSDGNGELLLELSDSNILILHKSQEIMYGYLFPYRGMNNVKMNGEFCCSGGSDILYIGKLAFDKNNCSFVEKCIKDKEENIFRIDKKNSTYDKTTKYIEDWYDDGNEVQWKEIKNIK